jgi:hypothetical protein
MVPKTAVELRADDIPLCNDADEKRDMTSQFTYNDILVVDDDAPAEFRPGERAWVIGVFVDREKDKFDWLPAGVVYTVEFEDGEAIDMNEDILRRYDG